MLSLTFPAKILAILLVIYLLLIFIPHETASLRHSCGTRDDPNSDPSYSAQIAPRNVLYRLMGVLFILMVILIAPSELGKYTAERLSQGDLDSFELHIYSNGNNTSTLNKTFILITQSNNFYYLIEKQNTVPESIKLYAIPENQIKTMVMEYHQASNNIYLELMTNYFRGLSYRLNEIVKRRMPALICIFQ